MPKESNEPDLNRLKNRNKKSVHPVPPLGPMPASSIRSLPLSPSGPVPYSPRLKDLEIIFEDEKDTQEIDTKNFSAGKV